MLDNKNNIKIVVNLLKKNGISKIVISPGGTNIPFVEAVTIDPFFTCYSVVDERSAMYFAIGLYLQTGQVVATSCTSAQATRNYIPGLTEAFYKKVPILAITMSKHPRFTYQEYMQAPDQTSLPKDSVKKSISLPFLKDENDFLHSVRLTNEAINSLLCGNPGPVQLNIPWLDFKLDKIDDINTKIDKVCIYDSDCEWDFGIDNKKIMIVIGEHLPFDKDLKDAVDCFCRKFNVVVYTNHLSNFYNNYCVNANLFLSVQENNIIPEELVPDVIISIGGQTGDYPFYRTFSKSIYNKTEHWRVSPGGDIVDTYDKLTKVFKCSEFRFFSKLSKMKSANDTTFLEKWENMIGNISTCMELPFSNAFVAQYLHDKIPPNSIIQFSILNTLRVWNYFQLDPSIKCFSNVGAFGIDGGMSTLIGQSVVSDELCFMVIGDLAFYYDMNSIAIRHIRPNLRIILINNNGGVEFKYKSGPNIYTDRYVSAANHFKNAKGWAETCNFDYYSVYCKEELVNVSDTLLKKSDKPVILEVFVSDSMESEAYTRIIDRNSKNSMKKTIKKLVHKFMD